MKYNTQFIFKFSLIENPEHNSNYFRDTKQNSVFDCQYAYPTKNIYTK